MHSNIVEISGLTKKYGDFTAVDNLHLSIKKGEIFGLLGPNGAGKSTTILMLMGLTEPWSGSVKVCGIDPVRNPIEVKKRVGYLPEDIGFYDDLTGLENLKYTARLNGIPEQALDERAKELLQRVGLSDQMHKKAGKYSRGMRQRLGLADVLIKNPEVIILDEPTLGIDPSGIREFLDLIVRLSRKEKITVLFSSHHLHQVQQVCDRVGIFVNGKLLAEGNIQSLANQLFSGSALTIEAEITPVPSGNKKTDNPDFSVQNLVDAIKNLEGVAGVTQNNSKLSIECSEDITHKVAKIIIESGAGISYLNKKEHGLDDIYYRYFEGGVAYE